ncbi:MAG: hypothetical protein IJA87_08530 [Clostridia bacterium]|nr:hypothetical protein [Clostridia bacterium]
MKMTKKIISVLLAVMLVLGTVAVAASAEMLTEKAGTVLTYTATVKGKTANENGAIEVEPGEKITVEVYTQTNYYIGSVGSELFAWTDSFFGSITTEDWHLHNHINNYTPNQKYPVTGNQLGSNYASGYEGFLYGRAYNTNFTTPTDASTPVLSYSFDLTVEAGLEDGTTGKFLMPEQMLGLSTANARFRQIYASVASNADVYGTVADASQYPETINVSGAVINFVVKSAAAEVPCDYTDLNAAIAQYETDLADKALYTATSWADYEAAYTAAKAVTPNMIQDADGVNQGKIDAAEKALTDAKAALDLIEYCDYAALQQAVNNCSELDSAEEYYDPTDLATWKAALKAAQDLLAADKLEKSDENQAIIDNAAEVLTNAYDELYERYVDTSDLSEAIAAYKTPAQAPEYYDSAKYAAWQAALAAAQDGVIDYDGAADTEANRAAVAGLAADLKAAYEALTANYVDTTALSEAIAAYGTTDYTAEYYDATEYAAYTDALAAANTALSSLAQAPDTADNRAAVESFAADLKTAFEALDARFVDVTPLENVIAESVPAYADEYYNATALATFKQAVMYANQIVISYRAAADTEANRQVIATYVDQVRNAFEDLVPQFADVTALDKATKDYANTEYTAEYYDAAEYAAYTDALAAAVAGVTSYASAPATKQAEVDALATDLKTAFEALDARFADVTALDKATKDYANTEYTAEYYDAAEYEAYTDALAAAVAGVTAYATAPATKQAEVDALAADLKAAFEALDARFVDVSDLEAAIAESVPAYGAEYYDAAAYAAFQDELAAGNALVQAYKGAGADTEVNRNAVANAASAIRSAFAKLEPAFIDYSALEEAVKNYGTTPEAADNYTAVTYEPYAAALERAQAMLKDKNENAPASDTALAAQIAAAAAELESTFKALELAPTEPPVEPELTIVTSVTAKQEYYKVGDTVNFDVVCNITNVTKVQFVFENGSTTTYHRAHSAVTVKDNGDGTETWTIAHKVYFENADAVAKAKLGKVWEDNGYAFTIETKTDEDYSVKSAEVLLDDAAVTEFTVDDTVVIKIVCGPSTLRMRLVDKSNGCTSTYSRSKATQDENGNWVWLITRKCDAGNYAFDIYTTGSENYLTDEGTDLTFTVTAAPVITGPSTGDDADIVVSATAKARVLRGNTQTFTIVTDKLATGVRVTDQYGSVQTYSKDVATAVDNGDGTLTWTLTVACSHADTYTCTVEALYLAGWMSNGTTVSYRVVY